MLQPSLNLIYNLYFTKIPAKWWIHLEECFPGEILGISLVQYVVKFTVDVKILFQ